MNITAEPGLWLQLAIVVWNCGLTAALWLRKPGIDAGQAVDELRTDMDSRFKHLDKQVVEIRAHMTHMPTTSELAKLEGVVANLNERATGLHDNMITVRASLVRIEDYLLRRNG